MKINNDSLDDIINKFEVNFELMPLLEALKQKRNIGGAEYQFFEEQKIEFAFTYVDNGIYKLRLVLGGHATERDKLAINAFVYDPITKLLLIDKFDSPSVSLILKSDRQQNGHLKIPVSSAKNPDKTEVFYGFELEDYKKLLEIGPEPYKARLHTGKQLV